MDMWNQHDQEYARLLKLVVNEGRVKKNRTGIDTKGVFGAQARFDLSKGFPLLTTKKVFFKGIVHELLWFLSGSTNIKYLADNDVHIWDGNAFDLYQKKRESGILLVDPLKLTNQELEVSRGGSAGTWALTQVVKANVERKRAEFIQKIKDDPKFAAKHGELGEGTYGGMWRDFPFHQSQYSDFAEGKDNINWSGTDFRFGVDQVGKVVKTLRTNPDDRRMIVSAWHPYYVDHCALPPCHVLFHFNTEELTENERYFELIKRKPWADDCSQTEIRDLLAGENIPTRRLNCLLYQRSCDLFLGVPFNIASYALLTHMMAHVTNMLPGDFIHSYGDLHIYENHFKQVYQQLGNGSFAAPTITLNPDVKEIDAFKFDDIKLENYISQPTIKAEMAV